MSKATLAHALATAISSLLETNGLLDEKQYLGCARDAQGRPFLIRDNQAPIGFEPSEDGKVVLNSEKIKGATKYVRDTQREEREVFNEYCAANGLSNQFYFLCTSMEKAMTIATLANAAQQFQVQGDDATNTQLVMGTVKSTLANFSEAMNHVDPQLLKDDDSLVQAMINAGMTPVNDQGEPVKPAQADPSIRKVEETVNAGGFTDLPKQDVPVDKYSQSEQLVTLMKQRENLSPVEKELVDRLERMITRDRAHDARLLQIQTDPQNSVEESIAHLLNGPYIAPWLVNSL